MIGVPKGRIKKNKKKTEARVWQSVIREHGVISKVAALSAL